MAHAKVVTYKQPLPPKRVLSDIFAFPPNPDTSGDDVPYKAYRSQTVIQDGFEVFPVPFNLG